MNKKWSLLSGNDHFFIHGYRCLAGFCLGINIPCIKALMINRLLYFIFSLTLSRT